MIIVNCIKRQGRRLLHRAVLVGAISIMPASDIGLNAASNPAGCTDQNAPASGTPVITSASSAQIIQGASFDYQITATGTPSRFGAVGLPNGLTLDSSSGVISGIVSATGPAMVSLTATNSEGTGAATLSLTAVHTPDANGSQHNCDPGTVPPYQATNQGFNSLVFCDDFDSTATIDVAATGNAGYKWYTYNQASQYLPTSAYRVANSALTIWDVAFNNNWGLSTEDIRTYKGQTFMFGYFEARIDFDPTLGPLARGWPAVWLFSARHKEAPGGMHDPTPWSEVDIFEALSSGSPADYFGVFAGTIHQWQWNGGQEIEGFVNTKNKVRPGVEWNNWHIVGVLWVRGRVTWYLDGYPLLTQGYGASARGNPPAYNCRGSMAVPQGVFTNLDSEPEGMMLILGSGPQWPMNVDWVRVWR